MSQSAPAAPSAAPTTPNTREAKTPSDAPAASAASAATVEPNGPSARSGFVGACVGIFKEVRKAVDGLIDSAAGYDERILDQYGTATDEMRRRNIGRAILVATTVGALGWFTKILMSFPGWLALPIATVMAVLYAALAYSLESFFAANVNPYARLHSKLFSLLGRTALSAVIAFAGALPWMTIALKSSVQLEMSKIGLAEQAALRGGLDSTYGLAGINAKATALQGETQTWSNALTTLPAPIQTALDQAQACAVDFERLKTGSEARAVVLTGRLATLAKLESALNATQATRQAVAVERGQIRAATARLAQETAAKKSECTEQATASAAAKQAHITFATAEREASQRRLAALRAEEGEVDAKVRTERTRVDALIQETTQANSSAEFSALINIIKTQLFAQVLGGLIFFGLLLVDALPLTLRLFARPGPYDKEKQTDDEIKTMRAEGRLMEARMMHEARRKEMDSPELQRSIQDACRKHIQSIALNGVQAFLRKQKGPGAQEPQT